MAVNWGSFGTGAAGGAMAGSAFGPWGTALGGIGGGLMGLFSGEDEEIKLEDLRTPEQKAAAAALQQLGMTGSYGDINLGDAYTGSLGSYDTSGQSTAYQQLMDLYGGKELTQASDVYSRMANNKFNPDDPSSGYASFSRALAKAGAESSSVLDREAAISGNRFGTAIAGEKANLAADLANQRGTYLADLYNQSENRALQGAAGLTGLAGTKSNIATSAAQQAILINQIKDAQAKDALNEYKRQRAETLSRIDILSQEANRNPYLGVSSIPTGESSSPFSGLVNSVLSSYGKGLGSKLASGGLSSLFGGGSNSGGTVNLSSLDTSGFGGTIDRSSINTTGWGNDL